MWQAASAGLNIIVNVANFGGYSFNAKGGELIMVGSTGFASGRHDATANITVNGSSCGRSQTNGHERAWAFILTHFALSPPRRV